MTLPIVLAIIKNMEIPSISWDVTLTLGRLWALAVIPELHMGTCARLFTAAVFLATERSWKQIDCPSSGEWIDKM